MSEPKPPLRRPVLGLVVVALVFLIPIGAAAIWQQVRWTFAAPLAVAFYEHDAAGDGQIHHAEVRKFLTLEAAAADELASSAGFDCKAFKFASGLGVCYRDVWTGLCTELWSLQFVFDDKKKISEVLAKKRQACLFQ